MSIWRRSATWEKVQLTINILLSMTQGALILGESKHVYNYIVLAGQIIGAVIGIWMVDKDKDGVPDVFQTEVKTTVTSTAPIEVKTEETPKQ